jgi:hypothetical protein
MQEVREVLALACFRVLLKKVEVFVVGCCAHINGDRQAV